MYKGAALRSRLEALSCATSEEGAFSEWAQDFINKLTPFVLVKTEDLKPGFKSQIVGMVDEYVEVIDEVKQRVDKQLEDYK